MTEPSSHMPLGRSSSMLVIVISCPSRLIPLADIEGVCISACTGFTAPQPVMSMMTASTAASDLRNALFEYFILLPAFFFISWDSMASQDLTDICCREFGMCLQLALRLCTECFEVISIIGVRMWDAHACNSALRSAHSADCFCARLRKVCHLMKSL